jgi:hypothetical protein
MKAVSIIILLCVAICSGCNKDNEDITVHFDYMHFVRFGGGSFEFKLYPDENHDIIKTDVILQYHHQDSTIHVSINKNIENESVFYSYYMSMKNEIELSGSFEQTTLYSGTWAFIYFVKDSVETEVTNTRLRDSLLKFERLVRKEIRLFFRIVLTDAK